MFNYLHSMVRFNTAWIVATVFSIDFFKLLLVKFIHINNKEVKKSPVPIKDWSMRGIFISIKWLSKKRNINN